MVSSSVPYLANFAVTCCSNRDGGGGGDKLQRVHRFKINGTSVTTKVVDLNVSHSTVSATMPAAPAPVVNGKAPADRTNIPTQKQFVDPYRQGLIILDGVGYRQTVVIRSYEVGADKTATPESILNLLQAMLNEVFLYTYIQSKREDSFSLAICLCMIPETALNHVWMSGLLGDGFGATHGMMKNNLIWVVSRMQVQVDQYPIWGEILEIDTWVGASGKNGMQRDWEIRSHTTGSVFARGTSTWVMMNQKTRRLSKMPDEVRGEISPWFIEKQAIKEESPEKIEKLDDNAKYVASGLQPKRSDLDMNLHVNNVKYVGWMLESLPDDFLEHHQLTNIILEYRRECGSSDVVQSLSHPEEGGIINGGGQHNQAVDLKINGCSLGAEILQGNGLLGCLMNEGPFRYTHLLQVKGESKNEEIVRGKTTWKRRLSPLPFSG